MSICIPTQSRQLSVSSIVHQSRARGTGRVEGTELTVITFPPSLQSQICDFSWHPNLTGGFSFNTSFLWTQGAQLTGKVQAGSKEEVLTLPCSPGTQADPVWNYKGPHHLCLWGGFCHAWTMPHWMPRVSWGDSVASIILTSAAGLVQTASTASRLKLIPQQYCSPQWEREILLVRAPLLRGRSVCLSISVFQPHPFLRPFWRWFPLVHHWFSLWVSGFWLPLPGWEYFLGEAHSESC